MALSLIFNQFGYLSHSMSPSNTNPFHSLFLSYPIQLDDDARLAISVSIVTIFDSRAVLEDGAVELTGAFGEVLHITAVLLGEVPVCDAFMVFLGLDGVIVGCREQEIRCAEKLSCYSSKIPV